MWAALSRRSFTACHRSLAGCSRTRPPLSSAGSSSPSPGWRPWDRHPTRSRTTPRSPTRRAGRRTTAIAARYGADPGGAAPLLPVVTLPRGETVRSPGVRADLRRLDARLQPRVAGRPHRLLRVHRQPAFVSADGRTVFALVYPTPGRRTPSSARTPTPRARPSAALRGADGRRPPVHLTGFDALAVSRAAARAAPGVLLEALHRAASARCSSSPSSSPRSSPSFRSSWRSSRS